MYVAIIGTGLVSDRGAGYVSVIDTTTNPPSIIRNPISVGNNADGIAYDPLSQRMYVTNFWSNNVSVIDTITNNVIGSPINVGMNPTDLAYDPVHQRMYVANFGSNTVFVIDIGSNAQTICPKESIQHWDKIVFKITSLDVAGNVNLPVDSELDIKVLDNPNVIIDIKKKILDFIHIPDTPEARGALLIISVDHSIVCA
jgi:YVTN family beta-propeller protein